MSKAKILLFLVFIALIVLIGAYVVVSNQPSPPDDLKYVQSPEGEDYLSFEYTPESEVQAQTNPQLDLDAEGFEPARTADDCSMRTGYLRDTCFSNLAIIKNDISICDAVGDAEFRDSCVFELATTAGNKEWCMELDYDIPDCLLQVAVKNHDPSACVDAGFEKDECVKAVSLGDFGLCAKLGVNRSMCNDAVDQKDSSICGNIPDGSQNCFYDLAVETLDAQFCEKVGVRKDACIFTVAVYSDNILACNLLTEGRDNCVATIALTTDNPALCDEAGFERQSCLDDFQALNGG